MFPSSSPFLPWPSSWLRNVPYGCSTTHTRLQAPKEELPPSPECWREHASKPNAIPYCYYKKPEIYTHWYALYDRRKERESQKILRKMRDHPRCVSILPVLHALPIF